ncbi:MAG TPA: GMC family oxidoreductase [Granulicella sp.]
MIRDLLHDRPEPVSADVCIVGAGAAGIVLAVELVRQGRSVLMLEGGGAEIEEPSQDPYRSELAGLLHRGVHTGRFRAKGGTTTKWGGQILELDARDFEQRAAVAGSGWPFAKDELTSFYERALVLEGMGSTERSDAQVWKQLGQAAPSFEGVEPYFSRWCPEPNFARLHGKVLEEHAGLTLWLHANAVELVLEGETARGVRCRTLTGVEHTFTAGEYVFCLGTIESSRFFLQPREGGLPWNRSGLLGRHFQDHIDCNAATVEPVDRARFSALFDNVFLNGFKYHPKLRLAPAIQDREGTLNVAATMNFASNIDEALGRIKTTAKHLLRGRLDEVSGRDIAYIAGHLPLLARQTWRYKVEHRAYNPSDATIYLRVHCEQEPEGESSITLSGERDSLGLLRTRLDWRIAKTELATIRRYVTFAQSALATAARVTPDPRLMSGAPEFLRSCDDSNHHMGGMRMEGPAGAGVVDSDLRLSGTRNVFVCSGAVFPTSGFSNPTHTLLALTVRLADHLGRS